MPSLTRRGTRFWLAPRLVAALLIGASSSLVLANGEPEEPGACGPGVAEATTAQVQARYEKIRDIRARFEQTNESSSFGGISLMSEEAKRGRVVFAKPGKMRWVYEEPEASLVVSDGETLWIHDVEAASVTQLEVTAGFLSGAALQFLLGDGQIAETFEVTAKRCVAERVDLDLLPRSEATYERLGLEVDPATGDVVGTSVVDLFGNLTRIRFSEIEVNRTPPDDTFRLEVPEGVEVIEYQGVAPR